MLSLPLGIPCSSVGKESARNAGDRDSIPGSGRSPGEGNGNPLQYSCLGNPMDRGAWWATVHEVVRVGLNLATQPPAPVTKSCPTLCDSTDYSTLDFSVLLNLPEFGQAHVHCIGDAIQPSHPLSPTSPPALSLSYQRWITTIQEMTRHTSLVAQWLRLRALSAGSPDLISGQRTRSHMLQ